MKSVIRQLNHWRLRERLIRLSWGGARWLAIVGTVLALACLIDWAIDRYSGSQTWRDLRKSSWLFAPSDPLSVGETPFWWCRVPMTVAQLALAGVLAYFLLLRPWVKTPPVDDFATQAEKAFPAFDHRLVTAIQLNRPTADTRGMSKVLIAEVTREAGEIASRHDLLKLVDYRRLGWAAGVVAPVAVLWVLFFALNPSLATILVKRQALLDVEIPRDIHLKNVTQEVWPTGSEVTVRFEVTGKYREDMVGVLRLVPFEPILGIKLERDETLTVSGVEDGSPASVAGLKVDDVIQKLDGAEVKEKRKFLDAVSKKRPGEAVKLHISRKGEVLEVEAVIDVKYHAEEFYELKHEKLIGTDTAYFSVTLPPMSRDFKFQARLGAGRTKEPSEVRFEYPPQLDEKEGLRGEQLLPAYVGLDPDGDRYIRKNDGWTRGEIIDALPQSAIRVRAKFNKPVRRAVLIPIERGEGLKPQDLPEKQPYYKSDDRTQAEWGFDTTPRMTGYRIELEDDRGFKNPVPIRRNIRMWEDRPPAVEFRAESTRDPDPNSRYGMGNPKDYEWDMPVGPEGRIQVIYQTHSDLGVRAANIVYRVIPKGVQQDLLPEEYRKIQHPREDKNGIVYNRLPLKLFVIDPKKPSPGRFVTELGKFEQSGKFGEVEFYPFPSPNPLEEPAALGGGGCKNFEVSGLLKKVPVLDAEGRPVRNALGEVLLTTAKLEVGDTVELYVEVYDRLTGPDGKVPFDRPPGYTREAKRKIVLSEADAEQAIRQRDEARQKLRDKLQDIANDQRNVFTPKPK